ncbi:MAG: hypothetical protein ACK4KX_03100 [Parvibaculum sp.]|uniref:hypothetical protein n=1 Tax=Parvibaculum sp. TaxID=2024848 RepID=UPI00391D19D7
MSDEPWFPDREVAIVLTGEEWFVILAKLADPDSLTERGRRGLRGGGNQVRRAAQR